MSRLTPEQEKLFEEYITHTEVSDDRMDDVHAWFMLNLLGLGAREMQANDVIPVDSLGVAATPTTVAEFITWFLKQWPVYRVEVTQDKRRQHLTLNEIKDQRKVLRVLEDEIKVFKATLPEKKRKDDDEDDTTAATAL